MRNELMHYGVLGMKWGVRRYQNKDGTLNSDRRGQKRLAKDLKKEYARDLAKARVGKTSDNYNKKLRDSINKVVTDEDKKRITDARRKWLDSLDETWAAEAALDELARKYGKEFYDKELQANPHAYNTQRAKENLMDYAIIEYGYDTAEKSRPDLVKAGKTANRNWQSYTEECRKVSDKMLGAYGNTKIGDVNYPSTIRDTVGTVVMKMDDVWSKK